MSREVEPLLERIDKDLEECDARTLPPLASGPAAAVFDLAEQAGMELTPWQQSLIRTMYAVEPILEPDPGRAGGGLRMRYVGPGSRSAAIQGVSAGEPIVDEVPKPPPADPTVWPEPRRAPEPSRPWWRRWWSR